MAVTPPSALKTGDPLTAIVPWTQKIVAYLRAITPRPSATVNVSVTPNGTLLSAAPSQTSRATSAADTQMAFTAYASPVYAKDGETIDYVNLTMLGGPVQGLFGDITFIETTDFDRSKHIHDLEYFWLEFDPQTKTWSLEHDLDAPQAANTEDPNDPLYFTIVPLFRVEVGRTRSNVVQYHHGAVFVPTATNAVEIQPHSAGEDGDPAPAS